MDLVEVLEYFDGFGVADAGLVMEGKMARSVRLFPRCLQNWKYSELEVFPELDALPDPTSPTPHTDCAHSVT